MRKFKANLTIQQHEQLGLQIKPFKDLMCHVVVELSNRYGKTSRQAKLADVVWRKLGDLKSALEDCAFNDHPGEATTDLYYWATEPKQRPDWLYEGDWT
jgi:hypothetical protein